MKSFLSGLAIRFVFNLPEHYCKDRIQHWMVFRRLQSAIRPAASSGYNRRDPAVCHEKAGTGMDTHWRGSCNNSRGPADGPADLFQTDYPVYYNSDVCLRRCGHWPDDPGDCTDKEQVGT